MAKESNLKDKILVIFNIFLFVILIVFALIIANELQSITPNYTLIIILGVILIPITVYFFMGHEKNLKEINNLKEQQERKKNEQIEDQKEQTQKKLNEKLSKVNDLTKKVEQVNTIEVPNTKEVKEFILENEKVIIEKGGDDKLFQFLKVDSFIQDFKKSIENDIHNIVDNYSEYDIKNAIKEYHSEANSIQRITDGFKDIYASIDGHEGTSINAKIERLFKIGDNLKPAIEKEIATLNFYKSISIAMIVFYMNDNKILYFELYEAFDKLGAFDNSWQKNVASKLDSIDVRLANLNNQMDLLSSEFTRIANNSEKIVTELQNGFEKLHSQINGTNLLLGITAYQTYKINKNTKGTNS